jgi:hypothetical protein
MNYLVRLMRGDCRIEWDLVARNCVFSYHLIAEEQCEVLRSLAIVKHVFSSIMKVVVDNDREDEFED